MNHCVPGEMRLDVWVVEISFPINKGIKSLDRHSLHFLGWWETQLFT